MDPSVPLAVAKAGLPTALRGWNKRRQQATPFAYAQEPTPIVPWRVALPSSAVLSSPNAPGLRTPEMEIYRWLLAHDGADVSDAHYRVSLYNPGPATVVIRRVLADVVHASAPDHAVEAMMPSAGAEGALLLFVDLDEQSPVAHAAQLDGSIHVESHRWGDRGETLSLPPDSGVEILLIARTKRRVDWTPAFVGHLNDRALTRFERRGDLDCAPISTTGSNPEAVLWMCPSVAGPIFQTYDDAMRRAAEPHDQ